MNEGTRFGPTVHLLKVVQDSDAYCQSGVPKSWTAR